ncbi:murein hydrolase effector protein LrgB [Paenibacillus larvae subsp. pulvifaciens]|uniref:Murein hydrolase effector protein LrgB n=1 Tax=Paenibacillus larvae subsp. pulvifaciens TaxID=1477 RepID=A0A1V0UNN7_9BACL|nr:LrgB family protein [Paenibacillus larvae]ARF66869.1 murein hydrolase effector protein LrgB [Paenibacillus larvae subsp. pulvifaciens]
MKHNLLYHPLFGVTVSILAYVCGILVNQRFPRIHPLFLSSGGIILLLLLFHIPYEAYTAGGDLLTFFLGPATVALGVPLYKFRNRIRKHLFAVITGITTGSLAGILSAGIIVWSLGGTKEMILSMMPKSVSSPIAIELSRLTGGIPELSAVLAVLTGLMGSMFGRAFLWRLGICEDLPLGIAIGTAAHGIGTSKLIRSSESEGSFSAFAMALAGIITGILFIPIVWWLHL